MDTPQTLHEIRLESGCSLEEFAQRASVKVRTVLIWEIRDGGFSRQDVSRISKLYGRPEEEVEKRKPTDMYIKRARQNLKLCRTERKLTQKMASELLGCELGVTSLFERNPASMPERVIDRLEECYGITQEELFLEPDEQPRSQAHLLQETLALNTMAMRYHRTRAGMTMAGMASALSITQKRYTAWEQGSKPVPVKYAESMATLWGVTVETLCRPPVYKDLRVKTETMLKLPDLLREARMKAGLTQYDVEKALHLSTIMISAFERGEVMPSLLFLNGFEELYGTTFDLAEELN